MRNEINTWYVSFFFGFLFMLSRKLFLCYLLQSETLLDFWIYMIMSILAFVFVLKLIPEAKGKSLEEIELFWTPQSDNEKVTSFT